MRRPFSTLAGLFILFIAVAQGARAFLGLELIVGTFHVPVMTSWIAAGIAAVLGLGALSEGGR